MATDDRYQRARELAQQLGHELHAIADEQRPASPDHYHEPPVAKVARAIANDLLESADAHGLGGCPLCQA